MEDQILASRKIRLIASIVDFIMLLLPFFIYAIILVIIGIITGNMDKMDSETENPNPIIIFFLGTYFYAFLIIQVVLLTKNGQTVGKKIFKIQIVDDTLGYPGGFKQNCLIREILMNLLGNITCGIFFIVDLLYIFGEDKRCLHDVIAKTKVIKI
jgi:uncharacterized RDD family membrane protein YckC